MKRIAIDMDETIADAVGKHVKLYNEAFGAAIERDVFGSGIRTAVPEEHLPAVYAMLETQDFFADLEVLPDSPQVIEELTRKFEVFISSSAMEVPSSFAAKYSWLARHFPFIQPSHIVFCGDKSILAADFLIDDSARHFVKFRGEGILFSAPHNRGVTGYRRVESWQDVRRMLL